MENLLSRAHRWLTTLALCIVSALSTTALADEVITFSASELFSKSTLSKSASNGDKVKITASKVFQNGASYGIDDFAYCTSSSVVISSDRNINQVVVKGFCAGYNNYCEFTSNSAYTIDVVEKSAESMVYNTITPNTQPCTRITLTPYGGIFMGDVSVSIADPDQGGGEEGGEGGGVTPAATTTATFDFTGYNGRGETYKVGDVITAPKTTVALTYVETLYGNSRLNHSSGYGGALQADGLKFTISVPAGCSIKTVEFTGPNVSLLQADGLTDGYWTGDAQSLTFTAPKWETVKINSIDVKCTGDISAKDTPDVDPDEPAAGEFKYTALVSGTGKTILDTDKIHEVITFDGTVTLVQIVVSEDWDGNKTYADPKFQILDATGNYVADTQAKVSGKTLVADFGPLEAGSYVLRLAKGAYAVGGVISTKELRLPYTVTSTKPQLTAGQLHYDAMSDGEQDNKTAIQADVITFDADVTLDASKTITIDGKAVASAQAMSKNLIVQFGTALALGRHTLRIPAGAVTVGNVYNADEIVITYNIIDRDHTAIFDFTLGDEKWNSTTGSISVTGQQGSKIGVQAGLIVYKNYSGTNYSATFTAANGCTIESIAFDSSYALAPTVGTLNGAVWTGSAQTVTFSAAETIIYNIIKSATVTFSGTPTALEYTVHITGDVPADASVTVAGKPVADGTKMQTFATLTDEDVVAEYDDYVVTVDVAGTDITVNYADAGTTTFRFDTVDFGTTKNGITVKAGGAFNDNFGALQLSTGASISFTAPEGYKISRIDFATSANSSYGINLDGERGTFASGTWTGLEKVVTLTSTYITHVAKAIVTIEEFVPPTPFAPTNFTVNYGQDITNGGSADYAVSSIEVRYAHPLVFTNETPAGVTLTRDGEAVPFTSFTTGYTVGDEVISYFGVRPAEQIVVPGTYRLTIPEGVLVNAENEDHVNAAVDFEFVVPVLDEFDYEKDGKYDTKDVKALQDMILAPVTEDEYGYPHGSYQSVGDIVKLIKVLRDMAK